MNFEDISPDILKELAKEVIAELKIDFSDLQIDEESLVKLVSIDLLDKYSKLDDNTKLVAILASNVALVVENFILHLTILKMAKQHES